MLISGFAGSNRANHPRNLSESVGVESVNQKPGRGDLRPWRQPLQVATVPTTSQRRTIVPYARDSVAESLYWLSWTPVVHAIRSLDANDTTKRMFYTGDGAPKFTDNTTLTNLGENPQAWRPLGVPAPITPLLAAIDTPGDEDAGTEETWGYVHTFVTDLGWESGPSPVSNMLTDFPGATATLSSLEAPPAGNYFINRRRIYRTKTGTSDETEFFFLREVPIGTTETEDDARELGDVLATQGTGSLGQWAPPPADAKWLTAMWNGMAAVISGKSVMFCVPNALYAWPLAWAQTFNDTPVALAVYHQYLVVLTTGMPYLLSGDTPAGLIPEPLKIDQACVAPQSVVSFGTGVVWACPDGLAWLGVDGARLITAGVMTRDDWQAINPASIVAERYEGVYFASYNDGTGLKGFMIDPANPTGIYWLDKGYHAMVRDSLTDALYVLDGGSVKQWDAGAAAMTSRFRSKCFRGGDWTWGQVTADAYPVTVRIFEWHPETPVLHSQRVVPDGDEFSLEDGWPEDFQVEIETSRPVQFVQLVHAVKDLV